MEPEYKVGENMKKYRLTPAGTPVRMMQGQSLGITAS